MGQLAITPSSAIAAMPAAGEGEQEASLKPARQFYYAGLLLIGQQSLRPVLELTLSEYMFFAALLLTLATPSRWRGRQGYVPTGIVVGAYVFVLGALVSTFASAEPAESLSVVARFVFLTLVWFWLGTVLLQRPEHVRTAATCWVISIAVSGGAAVAQLLWGDVIPGTATFYGRMTGFAQHVNDLGGSSAVAIAAAIWLAQTGTGSMRIGAAAVSAALLVATGVLLSGSVGGLIAATTGVAVFVLLTRPSPRVVMLFVFAAGAAFGLVRLQVLHDAPTPAERIEQVREEGGTLWSRLDTFEAAIERIERNPVVGVGLSTRGATTEAGQEVHNSLLGTWYQGGALAALGLLIVIGSSFGVALGARKDARSGQERLLATALLACFAAYVAFGMGAPTLYARYGWVPIVIALALRAQQREAGQHSHEAPAHRVHHTYREVLDG